jgi:hypothetical protein
MTWPWAAWPVYVVSFIPADGGPPPHASPRLVEHLRRYDMLEQTVVCAGPNRSMPTVRYLDLEANGATLKIFGAHMAAVRHHALHGVPGTPCVVIETDVEFLYEPTELARRIAEIMARVGDDYDCINLGAVPAGLTLPIGSGLALCQAPVGAHFLLYHWAQCHRFGVGGALLLPPAHGEACRSIAPSRRYVASPPLATQADWPGCSPVWMKRRMRFGALHTGVHALLAWVINAVVLGLAATAVGLACARRPRAAVGVGVASVGLVGLVALVGASSGSPSHVRFRPVFRRVTSQPGFMDDFCPAGSRDDLRPSTGGAAAVAGPAGPTRPPTRRASGG